MAKQQYLDLTGLTTYNNEIQTQLDGKSNTNHTHNYAGSSSAGGAATSANKVNSSLTVQLNGGTTEGTNKFTFNGSAAKSVNITPSGIGASASSHTHDDRYYTESEIDTKLSGKAPSSHNHSGSEITTGTVALARGGTGADLSSVPAGGVIAKSSSGDKLSYWAQVPIERGGTGAATAAGARTNLEITPDNIGAAPSTHTHDYLPLDGGELTGALKLPKLSATNTNAYIGSMTIPFQQIYVKQNYLQDGVNETIDYGSFHVQTNGTTSTVGQTQLNVGNSTTSGKAGNSQGIVRVYGTGAYYHQLQGAPTANRTITLPDATGTIALTGHNHSASNITSGTLAVARGGTGNTSGYIRAGALADSTIGTMATAEGRNVTASGSYCHAEGNYTEASGSSAHAEGQSSTASGIASHAEGNNATASGNYSHAEGDFTSASAKGAHVEGTYTLASSEYQHVQGKFNVEDKAGTYAHIVGNGESTSARSNAHTLDWDGNAWFAGDVYVGGTDQSTGSKVLTGDHTHSQLNGSTTYGSGIEVADYNSSVSYLKPLRNSGGVNLGFDDYRFGNLYLTDTIYIGDNGSGTTTSSNDVRINSMGVYVGGTNLENNLVNASTAYGDVTLLASAFRPTITNKLSCGGSNYIWTQVYANKTSITSSDRRIKRNIKDLDDRYIQLFDLIEPKSYYLLDGDRIHTGFISQDVEEAMKQVGLTAEELAFFCKHIKTEAIYDENGNWVEDKEVLDENGNPIYIYALRYEEYIAIMAEKIKRLEAKYNSKLEELDEKLVKVDEKLAQLDSKLNK